MRCSGYEIYITHLDDLEIHIEGLSIAAGKFHLLLGHDAVTRSATISTNLGLTF